MKSFMVLLVLCLLPGANAAADLYRCAAPGGQASYQQSPDCPNGQRLTRVINYRPVPDSAPLAAGNVADRRILRSGTARPQRGFASQRQPSGRGKRTLTDNERCTLAKQARAKASERLGLKRTYEDLSRLDAPVRAACRW